jgi:hypothetical protein
MLKIFLASSLLVLAAANISGNDLVFQPNFRGFHSVPLIGGGQPFIPSIQDFYSNVSTKLNNEFKDANKLNAEMMRTASRMYNAMNTWNTGEGRRERGFFIIFAKIIRHRLQTFSSIKRTDKTFKSQCIENARRLENGIEAIMTMLTAKNAYGDDLIQAIQGDDSVSTPSTFTCVHGLSFFVFWSKVVLP